ncbi:MAG: DUF86 domain-containing protein [Firmicutes bacterium]|nr:DUF86 domain-containing protein [Bacillota bacterium]
MADDVVINKAAGIERAVARAREEYYRDPAGFAADFTRQDAAILNIERACEAALDLGQHLIRRDRLGVPQSARDVFTLLERAGRLPAELADSLRRMVGFRNIAVYDYQALSLPVVVRVIEHGLPDLERFSALCLQAEPRAREG